MKAIFCGTCLPALGHSETAVTGMARNPPPWKERNTD